MAEYGKYFLISALLFVFGSSAFCGETWRLEKGDGLKAVSAAKGEDRYLLAVSEIKKLANNGETEALIKAFEDFKKEYPEVRGRDFEAFVDAEVLFSDGKFVKAGRAYEKFLKSFSASELYDVVLDRQFTIATAFLNGQKKPILKVFKIRGYAEGAKIMERIGDRAGGGPIGIRAAVSVAESFEKRGKFDDAYLKWSEINSLWPSGQIGNKSLLAMGRCKHAGYTGPNYDDSYLVSAKSYYINYRLKYPDDAKKYKISEKIDLIDEQLAYKQFCVGKYYQKSGSSESAGVYYKKVIEKWPGTTASKMARAALEEQEPGIKKEDK
jgi:outer membrane protein assembly factor BamD (BamD/ComL family)